MTPETTSIPSDSPFHCSAEWHLRQMKAELAPLLYSWARRLSAKSGVFSASAENVAKYFGVHHNSVLRAIKELVETGFFQLERREKFKPNTYIVVDHKSWAAHHPNRCVTEVSFPWTGEGDPLGRELYAISGGRVKFWPNQMEAYRKLDLPDEEIAWQFRNFMARYDGRHWNHAPYDFLGFLKALTGSTDNNRRLSTRPQPKVSTDHNRSSSPTTTEGGQVVDISLRGKSSKREKSIPGSLSAAGRDGSLALSLQPEEQNQPRQNKPQTTPVGRDQKYERPSIWDSPEQRKEAYAEVEEVTKARKAKAAGAVAQ
jgi:hypothetical protein